VRINDIYACVQGEGCLAGTPMALVRLQGCGVGCPWCDTRETWALDEAHKVARLEDALGTGPKWCDAVVHEVAMTARNAVGPGVKWALITGGEPAEQSLGGLALSLSCHGFKVALETSGTALGHLGAAIDWVCVSPKLNMPGGKAVLPEAIKSADEIKHVVGKPADIDALVELLGRHKTKPGVQVCLQPVSQNDKATKLCVETCKRTGWRLSLQLHKYLSER
jgi:7-carboxy-7-deazaguanine synthase